MSHHIKHAIAATVLLNLALPAMAQDNPVEIRNTFLQAATPTQQPESAPTKETKTEPLQPKSEPAKKPPKPRVETAEGGNPVTNKIWHVCTKPFVVTGKALHKVGEKTGINHGLHCADLKIQAVSERCTKYQGLANMAGAGANLAGGMANVSK